MTEPYNIPLPVVASPPTYLLLIDRRVSNYQDIINAKQPGVHHIVFDAPSRPTHSTKLIKNIEDQIAALGVPAITSIGLVQHNDGRPIYEMFGPLSDLVKPQIHAVATHDPDFQTWNSISIFITKLRRNYGIVNFDMMACALYSNPDWKYIIDRLTALTGVTVRASTDDTGAASLGGDWFLESHTGVNLKSTYFTDAIENYNGILVSSANDENGTTTTAAKKLILIDHTIPDIHVIINAMNDDTYCLVFNTQYDTEDTILSKIRFLSGTNRYILDAFHYADAADAADAAVLTPAQLRTETEWQFYPDSTPTISFIQPVFFQRAIPNTTTTTTTTTTSEPDVPDVSSYVPRDRIRITELDEIYEIAKASGEANDDIVFECIGIIQHAPLTTLGYKLTNTSSSYATIENVASVDPNLSSWSQFSAFLERLKSVYHMTTLDLMACALYANPDWKYIIDQLAAQHTITIRASLDNTGNTNDGGNWILETAEINLTTVYFTNAIHEWAHLLPTSLTTLRFDGVDDAVSLGIPAWSYSTQFRSTMTIECWFKTTDTNNQKLGEFVSKWNTGGMFLLGMLSTGEITCWILNASGTFALIQTSATYKDTQWHHVAVTYNSSTGVLSMYIDGVFMNNSTNSAYPTTSSYGLLSNNTSTRVIFGSDDAGTSPNTQTDRQFRGSLSDIRIWNVVRSGEEIAANYRRRLIGNETGLIGYWKLHQGNGTGWTTYNRAIDSTSNRTHGTLISMGASPSSSWVTTTDLSFNPRISTLTLGANNGVYNTSDGSFSFIDPSSNSLGTFSYAVTPSSIATVANGAATTKTIYATSGAISIPTLSVYDFPEIASLSSWQIDISFTVTGGSGTWRGLVGDMYNVVNDRGWGLWVSSSNRIHWSWVSTTAEPSTIAVSLNTAYVLTAAQSSGTITLTLRTVSNGAIQTGSFSVGANVIGKGPVTIGGWQIPNSENFPGTISYVNVSVPTNHRVVTISSGTAGTPATVTATQDSSLDFGVGTQTAALTVNSSSPTIGTLTVPAKIFGDASFNLTAPTSNSSGAFSYTSSNTAVATVTSGGTVTIVGAGSTTITATQAASGNYTTGSVTALLVVSAIAPTIGTLTAPAKNFGDAAFNLTAPTSNSNGAFSYTSSNTAVATVTSGGGMVTIVRVGSTIITATQAASGNYTTGSVTALLVISTIAPTIASFSVPAKNFGNAAFNLTAPASNSDGAFTYTSSNTAVATVTSGGTVTIVGVGSTTITATQAASGNYTTGSVTASLVISAIAPTIGSFSVPAKIFGDASFNLTAPASNSNGAFTYTSSNTAVATVTSGGTVTVVGVGSTTITATQAASGNYTTGAVTASLVVSKATPVLSAFTVSSGRTYGASPFSALAYPSSNVNDGGVITYSSTDSTVATIDSSSGMITLLKAGYVNFIATQQATAFYNSVTKTSNTMTVYRQILPLTRSSPTSSTINKTYGDSYFNVVATNASNGGTITYETDNPSVAGIVGSATAGVISVVSVGNATITARRTETDQYESTPISWTVEVGRATTTLTGFAGLSDVSYNVTAAPFTVAASSASDGAVTYSLQDPSSGVLTIHPTTGLVTLRSAGSAVIVASQAQGTLYLAPASITARITVTSAGNALQGATITSTTSFAAVNLEGASLAGVSITNTAFTAANLTNANLTNAVIVSANFASADLSGATLAGATITGATFTSASLKNADLSGAVLTNTVFTGSDLSGARLTGVDASGASFANARLTNVDMTGANIENVNFTNTSIKGANIADVSFSPLQKLQLLKNSDNRDIGQIIIPAVTGTTVLAAISESSPLRAIENLDLASATVAVVVPTTSTSATAVLPDVVLNVAESDKFYLPINESEFFQIEGVKYFATGGIVRNYLTNAVVEVISYNGTPVWLLAGSIVGLVLQTNTLNSSSFVVPSRMLLTATTPFMPTTLPTSNNTTTPIVYSSDNTNVATIDASSGQITITGNTTGFVRFTATQVQNATYAPGVSVSNTLFVDRTVEFTLTGLNQVFNLSTLATLDASSISVESTDATAVFYVRLSDMNNVFMYQSDASDITNVTADDIKYYVFHRKWPSELKLNPSHAMLNKSESAGMLGNSEGFSSDKSLIKHDFIRYIALRLFNTIHGVDLFHNESELLENTTFLGETVRNNIDTILSGVSTTSASQNMTYDASGNKYLTNDASGNTNLCRELMRHIASVAPSRFYGNVPNHAGLKNVPFLEDDALQYKLVVQAAATQNLLTGVSEIPSRSYTIKFVLKNTVNASTNANAVVTDSEMYPNAYPYSTSVVTYAPTAESSSGVYNIYSPPAPIPFARFGYNGWYYTNSAAWVNVAPAVRNHVKWLVGANTATSKVSDLQYIRVNLKIHNTAALPYLMVYTQAGSSRKYVVVGGSGSLVNGTVYSFYMNFNSYAREPATIGATNAALAYTVGSGSFANNETITSIAVETDSNAAAGNVEFTLSSVVVGELNREKEYGFEAAVPGSYP